MKLFTTILATFMLSLFLFTGAANATVKASVVNLAAGNSSEQQSSHEEKDCTPFCAFCSCCQVVEIKSLPVQEAVFEDAPEISVSGMISSRPKDVSLPVWHPPQLS